MKKTMTKSRRTFDRLRVWMVYLFRFGRMQSIV